jgi:hypothetical protein
MTLDFSQNRFEVYSVLVLVQLLKRVNYSLR